MEIGLVPSLQIHILLLFIQITLNQDVAIVNEMNKHEMGLKASNLNS